MALRTTGQHDSRWIARARRVMLLVVGYTVFVQIPSAVAATKDLEFHFKVEGTVDDLSHTTSSSGRQFQVQFRDIAYVGDVKRTLLNQTDADHLTVWLSLTNLKLTIRSTTISGRRQSANCGPIEIAPGTQRELWVALDLKKTSQGGQVRLEHLRTRCDLPGDNWHVGSPAWVRPTGLGMSESKVVSGLRSGLLGKLETDRSIEEQFVSVGPTLYSKVEPRIHELLTTGQFASR